MYCVLTFDPAAFGDRWEAYREGGKCWNYSLREAFRRSVGAVDYLQTWESTRRGWPHLNLILSGDRLREAVDAYFEGRRLVLVFGASGDKDIAGMFRELLPRASTVLTTQAVHPRAADPDELAELVRGQGFTGSVESVGPVHRALTRARELAGVEDVVLATGSLFVVSEARAALTGDPAAYAKVK